MIKFGITFLYLFNHILSEFDKDKNANLNINTC